MSQQAMYRINSPRFTIKSRVGADRLAAELVSMIRAGKTDPQLVIDVLRDKAAGSRESARKFEERAAPAFKRGKSGWSLLALENARGYLIAVRAVEKAR